VHRWKSYLKGLKVKLLWLLSLKTSLGSWSLSCAGKHCLFKRFWDAWRGAYNRACWGWKELDFILDWHLQIAKKKRCQMAIFISGDRFPWKKKHETYREKKSGQKDGLKNTPLPSQEKSNIKPIGPDFWFTYYHLTSLLAAWCCKKLQTSKKNGRNEISCRCIFYLRRIIFSQLHSFTCD